MGMSTTDRARIAAFTRHSRGNTKEATEPARAGLQAKWEREVDPDGTLDPAERATRAARLRRAHMIRLAARSAQVRAKRAGK